MKQLDKLITFNEASEKKLWSQNNQTLNVIIGSISPLETYNVVRNFFNGGPYFVIYYNPKSLFILFDFLERELISSLSLNNGYNKLILKVKNKFNQIENWEVNIYV